MPAHVTFLLTEVVESVRRWEHDEAGMAAAAERLDVIVRSLVEQHSGVQVKPRGEGDSHFLTFDAPVDAVACAVSLQRAVADEPALALRSACHVGAADLRDGDWYGTTVNRCARLRGVAHPRQALVSADVAHAITALPVGVSLRSLGRHRLKDLDEPAEVFQLCAEGLVAEHPALVTLAQSHGLVLPGSSFVGRTREHDRAAPLLADGGVVSITGTPGVGTTRFAMAAAARWWEQTGLPVRLGPERLAAGELVVVDGAIGSSTLTGPAIVTSHMPLPITGATEIRLDPLEPAEAEQLLNNRLADDVHLPSGLVSHCDGLPLAIELLARRASSVDAAVLAARLAAEPLLILGGDRRADPPRHASVRATFRAALDAGWTVPKDPSPLVAAFFAEVNAPR